MGSQEDRNMMRLMVAFVLVAYCLPVSAASLPIPFAYDDAGRLVLEFYPTTVATFSAQGRDLLRITVKETPPERDALGPLDVGLIVDCQSRQLAMSSVTAAPKDGARNMTMDFKLSDLKPPNKGMYQRFVVALCDGELLGVQVSPAKSGWIHFLETGQRALYYVRGSARKIGTYRAASVRLYELGSAQLPDGRRIDARDAVWIIDCERKLGAVAYERAFARIGEQNQTVTSTGDQRAFADPSVVEVDKLTFGQAASSSMQAIFTAALCGMNVQ